MYNFNFKSELLFFTKCKIIYNLYTILHFVKILSGMYSNCIQFVYDHFCIQIVYSDCIQSVYSDCIQSVYSDCIQSVYSDCIQSVYSDCIQSVYNPERFFPRGEATSFGVT